MKTLFLKSNLVQSCPGPGEAEMGGFLELPGQIAKIPWYLQA